MILKSTFPLSQKQILSDKQLDEFPNYWPKQYLPPENTAGFALVLVHVCTSGTTVGYLAVFAVSFQVYSEQWHHDPEKRGDLLNSQMTAEEPDFRTDQDTNKLHVLQRQEQLTKQICESQQMLQDRFQVSPLEKQHQRMTSNINVQQL